jgi:hypothetical protein
MLVSSSPEVEEVVVVMMVDVEVEVAQFDAYNSHNA